MYELVQMYFVQTVRRFKRQIVLLGYFQQNLLQFRECNMRYYNSNKVYNMFGHKQFIFR